MVSINSSVIYETVKKLCLQANNKLQKEEYFAIKKLYTKEDNHKAKNVLAQILQNAQIAFAENRPLCQDTGFVTVFVEIGKDVVLNETLENTVNKAISDAYKEFYFRKSIVNDSLFERKNTLDNTPALLHTRITDGDKIQITLSIKGGGCENISAAKMLTPAQGINGVIDFVVETVKLGGAKPCPPIRIGIGTGSNFEGAAILSKKALLEPIEIPDNDITKNLANEIYEKVNALGIGAMGLGGKSTCFGVNILQEPCHIASLPVAVSISCHSSRHASATISKKEVLYEIQDYDFDEINQTNNETIKINTNEIEKIKNLPKGTAVELTGKIYTARDAAHKKFAELLNEKKELPINLKNAIIFYAGPCPAAQNEAIGPIGPTTSARMDKFTPQLYELGLLTTIGKGERSVEVMASMKKNSGKYFTITGGVASLLKKRIKSAKVIAYPELGAEAVFELEVENLPVLVNF